MEKASPEEFPELPARLRGCFGAACGRFPQGRALLGAGRGCPSAPSVWARAQSQPREPQQALLSFFPHGAGSAQNPQQPTLFLRLPSLGAGRGLPGVTAPHTPAPGSRALSRDSDRHTPARERHWMGHRDMEHSGDSGEGWNPCSGPCTQGIEAGGEGAAKTC